MREALDNYFQITYRKSTFRREIIGGATTFVTMAYIIFVNPIILSDTGMNYQAVITATILSTGLSTLLAGLFANLPFALAPGMGMNAFFTYSLVLGQGLNWQTALGVVGISGILFLVLSISNFREKIIKAIPTEIRLSISAGIGLFISLIGLNKLGLIQSNPNTLIGLGHFSPALGLGLFGLILTIVLQIRNIKSALLISMLATTVLALLLHEPQAIKAVPWNVNSSFHFNTFFDHLTSLFAAPPSIKPILFKLDILTALHFSLIGAIFSFMFLDLFDSIGAIVACGYEAGFIQQDGKIFNMKRILGVDSIASVIGAVMGTSTLTTYIESGAGIAAGARTGFASVITSGLFLIALFFTPLIKMVPSYATAPALIFVGTLMFRSAAKLNWSDLKVAIPAFLTMVLMPLTYSISLGLSFGFISYIIVQTTAGNAKKIPLVLWLIGIICLFELYITFT